MNDGGRPLRYPHQKTVIIEDLPRRNVSKSVIKYSQSTQTRADLTELKIRCLSHHEVWVADGESFFGAPVAKHFVLDPKVVVHDIDVQI